MGGVILAKRQNRAIATFGAVTAILAATGPSVLAAQVRQRPVPIHQDKHYHVSLKSVKALDELRSKAGQAKAPATHQEKMAPKLKQSTATPIDPSLPRYVVESGDTLWAMANQLGVTTQTLMDINHLKNSVIHVGQIIAVTAPLNQSEVQSAAVDAAPAQTSENVMVSGDSTATSNQPSAASAPTSAASSAEVTVQSTAVSRQGQATTVQPLVASNPKIHLISTPDADQNSVDHTVVSSISLDPQSHLTSVKTQAVNAAVSYVDQQIPYQQGGATNAGMDGSGVVQQAYAQIGVSLPHNTVAQEAYFTQEPVDQAQPGDVLFWGAPGMTTQNALYIGRGQYVTAIEPGQNVSVYTLDGQSMMPSFSGTLSQTDAVV